MFYNQVVYGRQDFHGAGMKPVSAELPLFLTITQAAEILTISPMMLYRYIWVKEGPRVRRIGGRRVIHRDDLMRWTEKDHPSPNRKD